jgi:hypothetical protein
MNIVEDEEGTSVAIRTSILIPFFVLLGQRYRASQINGDYFSKTFPSFKNVIETYLNSIFIQNSKIFDLIRNLISTMLPPLETRLFQMKMETWKIHSKSPQMS